MVLPGKLTQALEIKLPKKLSLSGGGSKTAEIHRARSSGLVVRDPGQKEVELRCFDHSSKVEVCPGKNRNFFEGLAIEVIATSNSSGGRIKVKVCVAEGSCCQLIFRGEDFSLKCFYELKAKHTCTL